jgi:hypothetical protein
MALLKAKTVDDKDPEAITNGFKTQCIINIPTP